MSQLQKIREEYGCSEDLAKMIREVINDPSLKIEDKPDVFMGVNNKISARAGQYFMAIRQAENNRAGNPITRSRTISSAKEKLKTLDALSTELKNILLKEFDTKEDGKVKHISDGRIS